MKNIPEVIYLQWYDDDGEEAEDITWCVDRINATDIEFRLTQFQDRRGLAAGSDAETRTDSLATETPGDAPAARLKPDC